MLALGLTEQYWDTLCYTKRQLLKLKFQVYYIVMITKLTDNFSYLILAKIDL